MHGTGKTPPLIVGLIILMIVLFAPHISGEARIFGIICLLLLGIIGLFRGADKKTSIDL
jgi:uncharacterized membrane protein YqjE